MSFIKLFFWLSENLNKVEETNNRLNLRNDNSFDVSDGNDVGNVVTSPTSASSSSYVVSETPTYQSIFANTLSLKQSASENNNSSNASWVIFFKLILSWTKGSELSWDLSGPRFDSYLPFKTESAVLIGVSPQRSPDWEKMHEPSASWKMFLQRSQEFCSTNWSSPKAIFLIECNSGFKNFVKATHWTRNSKA